jgi:hypothetical protein
VLLGDLDALDRQLEHAFTLDGDVMRLFHAVQVNVEEEAIVRFELPDLLLDEHPVGAEDDIAAALDQLVRKLADLGYSIGSPPQMDTVGAPHSSDAFRHCSSVSCCVMVFSYSRMRPHPVQVRLQACSGSSISTSGNRLLIMGCGLRSVLTWV